MDTVMSAAVTKPVQLDVVELLKNVLEWTPLYKPGLNRGLLQASRVGSAGCVRVLLSAGAEVDAEDENGDTAFVHAFRARHTEVMEVLRDAGCNTEIAKMSLALATKDIDFVKLCQKLDVPVENEDWNTVNSDEVKILLEELIMDPFESQYGKHGFEGSPFLYLAQEGKPDIIKLCIDKHPCLAKYAEDDRHEKMNAGLFKAVKGGRMENVKFFLDMLGADLEAKDNRGRTPLLVACERDEPVAKYLLERGADLRKKDDRGLGPLHWAACVGFTKLCEVLIQKGCCVDDKADLGVTPLMIACSNGNMITAQTLLQAGSDVNTATPEGWTALHVSVQAQRVLLIEMLLDTGASPDAHSMRLEQGDDTVPASTPLLIAIGENNMSIVKLLLEANCNIDLRGLVSAGSEHRPFSYQPIEYAVKTGRRHIAYVLLAAGCDIVFARKWFEDGTKLPPCLQSDRRLRESIKNRLNTPQKLRLITRKKVRRLLGHDMKTKVERLDLSVTMKECILLDDLFTNRSNEWDSIGEVST